MEKGFFVYLLTASTARRLTKIFAGISTKFTIQKLFGRIIVEEERKKGENERNLIKNTTRLLLSLRNPKKVLFGRSPDSRNGKRAPKDCQNRKVLLCSPSTRCAINFNWKTSDSSELSAISVVTSGKIIDPYTQQKLARSNLSAA